MADNFENINIGSFRSLDPPRNFAIRLRLKRVTAASIVPAVQLGSGPNLQAEDGAEQGEEAVEMTQRNQTDERSQVEELNVKWQEKYFCQREYELYSDVVNCHTHLAAMYHSDIKKIQEKGRRPNKQLFTYVDDDCYLVNQEQDVKMLNTESETPTYLAEKMRTVRRRNFDHKVEKRGQPFGAPADIVKTFDTEKSKTAAHVINTPYKVMYIMADLSPLSQPGSIDDEHILCTIKIDANGEIMVKPDFNSTDSPYRIETHNDLKEIYEYSIEHSSVTMTREEREREAKSFNELYNRHAKFLASQVGSEISQMPPPGILKVDIFGEIVSARDFELDGLYVHYFLELTDDWRAEDTAILSGVTQTCMTKEEDMDDVAYFSFPFEFSVWYQQPEDNPDAMIRWPILYIEVLSLDSWERFRTEGYGYLTLPNKPGSHDIEINTWRPTGNTVVPEMRRFFIGGSPELEDTTYVTKPAGFDDKVLSRFYLRTITSGSVKVRLNIVQQCQDYLETRSTGKKTKTLLSRIGGFGTLDSLSQVIDAFQRARIRMQSARENLPNVR